MTNIYLLFNNRTKKNYFGAEESKNIIKQLSR